jgi:hypothetical protein
LPLNPKSKIPNPKSRGGGLSPPGGPGNLSLGKLVGLLWAMKPIDKDANPATLAELKRILKMLPSLGKDRSELSAISQQQLPAINLTL